MSYFLFYLSFNELGKGDIDSKEGYFDWNKWDLLPKRQGKNHISKTNKVGKNNSISSSIYIGIGGGCTIE